MNNYWAFGAMQASNELLGDPAALQARMADQGYVLLRGLLDTASLRRVRRDVLGVLAEHGWVQGGDKVMGGVVTRPPVREGTDEYLAAYDDVQKLESFHALAHHEGLTGVVHQLLDDSAFPHPLKVARLTFPDNPEAATPPHQDFPNNQGTPSLTAAWIPLGDCPRKLGSLAILKGSHRFGVLPQGFHLGPGNRQAVVPDEVLSASTWVTTDMAAGDMVLFPALTVHASLNNDSFTMRLSVDFRYQRQGEPLTDMVLEPHFGRQTWEGIYAGWQSDALKYYWRDLDFKVIPFDRERFEATPPTDDDFKESLAYEFNSELRYRLRRGQPSMD